MGSPLVFGATALYADTKKDRNERRWAASSLRRQVMGKSYVVVLLALAGLMGCGAPNPETTCAACVAHGDLATSPPDFGLPRDGATQTSDLATHPPADLATHTTDLAIRADDLAVHANDLAVHANDLAVHANDLAVHANDLAVRANDLAPPPPPPVDMACAAESDAAFCARLDASCGVLTALDNCGHERSAGCGSCPLNGCMTSNTCISNQCSAVVEPDGNTCSGAPCSLVDECFPWLDSCNAGMCVEALAICNAVDPSTSMVQFHSRESNGASVGGVGLSCSCSGSIFVMTFSGGLAPYTQFCGSCVDFGPGLEKVCFQ
jgi:hypothetical protein